MKAATVFAVAFAALAQAQTRADIPACALPCLDAAVTANTKCSTTDYVCICKDFSAVQNDATSCVISKCGADVALNKVLPATQALCTANSGSGSSAAGSSSAAAASSSAAGTSAAASSAATSAAQTSAAQTSAPASSAPASSAPVSSAPVSSAPASSAAASSVPAGTGPSTTVITSVTPVGTGVPPAGNRTTTGHAGAPTNAGSVLLPGLAMLALGALAL